MAKPTKPKWIIEKNKILKYIDDKKLAPGDALPTDKELMKILNSTKQPFIRAMKELYYERIIDRGTGRNTIFLSRTPIVQDSFSFTHSAKEVFKVKLNTKLIELSQRTPLVINEFIDEKKVQKALELGTQEPFIVIVRLRIIDDVPRVIHRTYLNPKHFPSDFLLKHDFEKESLIDIYNSYGYKIIQRNTKIRARFPTEEEKILFNVDQVPVLSSYQIMNAVKNDANSELVIECMYATYLDWEFNISNRL